MRQTIVCMWLLCLPFLAFGQDLIVVDEQNKPVERFEVMIHTADKGYQSWRTGRDGWFNLSDINRFNFLETSKIDLLVRADGFASTAQSFREDRLKELRLWGAKITLERGREVRLKLQLPSGMTFPEGLAPDFYFPELAWRVEMMWQPSNRRDQAPDYNMLGAKRAGGVAGEYVFRLPRNRADFFVGIYHPGWLRYFKAGPFASDDFSNDQLTLDVPRPSTIAMKLDWGEHKATDLPFNGVQYQLMKENEARGTVWIAARQEAALDGMPLEVSDLAPGSYLVATQTKSKTNEGVMGRESPINPGRFSTRTKVDVQPGQVVRHIAHYVPFDPNANQGDRTARVQVFGVDGQPAAGKQLKVRWYDGHYGQLPIFDGPIPADGIVTLERISGVVHGDIPFGPYSVEVDGERLGFFRVAPEGPVEEFKFQLLPNTGATAPDAVFVALESGERIELKQLRGQLVFLEFWETACGPCQQPMASLNAIVRTQAAEWDGKVAVIPVCLDPDPETISNHVKSRGWTNLRHFRSERSTGEYFADAARAFGVMAYPTAFLIGSDGKIVWRGHPAQFNLVAEVQKLQRLSDHSP